MVMNEAITSWDIDNFNEAFKKSLEGIDKTQVSVTTLYSQINSAILSAAVDTIATRKRITYPKKVKKLKHYSTQDHMLHTWRKRMRGALRASRGHDLDAARKAVQRAEWPLSTVGAYKKPRFLKNPRFLSICEMEFSRCNCSIAAGFVLAWTSIGRLGLRAKLAGTGHLHPDSYHLVYGSVEGLAMITLVIITIYEMAFL